MIQDIDLKPGPNLRCFGPSLDPWPILWRQSKEKQYDVILEEHDYWNTVEWLVKISWYGNALAVYKKVAAKFRHSVRV